MSECKSSDQTYVPKLPVQNYENQKFYYQNPNSTYCLYPKDPIPTPIQTDVIYYRQNKPNQTYLAFPYAYPAYPYLPCMSPNVNSEN